MGKGVDVRREVRDRYVFRQKSGKSEETTKGGTEDEVCLTLKVLSEYLLPKRFMSR